MMKPLLTALSVVLFAHLSLAQSPFQNMTPEQQRQLMQQMQQNGMQMMQCYASIDPEIIKQTEKEATAIQAKVKQLCAAGKRKTAQQNAIQFGMKIQSSDFYKQVKSCGLPMQQYQEMAPFSSGADGRHVCDEPQ